MPWHEKGGKNLRRCLGARCGRAEAGTATGPHIQWRPFLRESARPELEEIRDTFPAAFNTLSCSSIRSVSRQRLLQRVPNSSMLVLHAANDALPNSMDRMTPHEFIAKWQKVELSERSACQQHFLDLCDLLGQPKPAEADPEGAWYTFERGVRKTEGGHGWADVWMRGHFGWKLLELNLAKAGYGKLRV